LQSKYENELVRQNTTNKEVDFLLKTVEGINKEISNLEEKIIKYESENSQNDEYIDKLEDQRKNYENLPKIFLELNDINDKILKLNVDITKIKTNLENNSKYFFTNILNKDLNDIIENNNDRINYLKDICGLNDLQAEYQAAREDIIKKSIPKCSVCGHTLSDKEIESLKNELDTIKSRLIQFNQNKKERDLLKDENDLYNEFLDIIEKFDYQYELDELYKKTSTLEALKKRKRELDLEGQKEEYGSLSDINKQISSLEQDITTNINHIEICREKIKGYKKKKDENLREIKKLSHNNTMTDNITNRITHITKLIQQLNEALELGTRSKRDKILAESNSLFNDITNKPQEYSGIDFESPDSYAFIIKKKDGKTVTKPSKGEKQVLAMSFLLGLSQYTGRNNVILMDTPVASLDDVHSAGIGKALANLDNQVIFLAQPQELNGDIYKNMKKRIAKQFNVIRDE
jgi:DNA sulfur modification protein DndD